MNDREITDQYRRLYGKVQNWSGQFLAPPQSIPTLTDAENQLVRVVFLMDNLDLILSNSFLRRSVMEGLVGHQISIMLAGSSMSPNHLELAPSSIIDAARSAPAAIAATAEVLRPIVQRYADTTVRDVSSGLDEILQNSHTLLHYLYTQPDVVFTISNPKRLLEFNRDFMESRGGGDGFEREVGVMVFPGLFKVTDSKRVCMLRARVICRDEAEI